ncbi:MAG: sulfotransferase domain-containing protein, partial [Proteobacteria bacterium]|nr:sulfotransferase domain-containing protein [Pseudomonadota bacterium]
LALLPKLQDGPIQWGRISLRYDAQEFFAAMMRASVVNLMEAGAGESDTHFGINDNMMASHGDLVARLMPRTRFIFIVRDPREVAVSLWHHKLRTEPAFAKRSPPITETIAFTARAWPEYIGKLRAFSEKWPRRCLFVRYEDLRGERRDRALKVMLDFLQAPASPPVLAGMWQATDFDALRSREKDKDGEKAGFFRAGKTDSWREEAPPEAIADLVRKAETPMKRLGYPLAV